MPKICDFDGCNNPRFGGGFCRWHQGYRTDKKPKKSGQTSKGKQKKSHIKPISDKRAEELAKYREVRAEYKKAHPQCEVLGCTKKGQDLHHKNERHGKRVYDSEYFMSVCRYHHRWIHENPKEAREMGYLV